MAFAYTVKKTTVFGDLRVVIGAYTNAGAGTGGAIATGLNEVLFFNSNCMTSQAATVNKVAISGGTVTITTVASEEGQWEAKGV